MKRLKFLSKLTLVGGLFWAIPGCPPQNNGNNDDGNDGRFDTPTRSSTIALTSDDRFAVVVNRETDSVAILEVRDANKNDTANLLAELAVGDEPRNVALLPDDSTAFVTNTASGTVSVIALDADNGFSVTDDIAVGTEPRGCAVTPNGTRLYVANHTNKTVSVINTDTLAVIATINLPGFPQA
ncbi:MAG: YncE family protein, partial [Phycisphaerae bacterium]|nr:YncE family protein [Phycisphaerae bacterium]